MYKVFRSTGTECNKMEFYMGHRGDFSKKPVYTDKFDSAMKSSEEEITFNIGVNEDDDIAIDLDHVAPNVKFVKFRTFMTDEGRED
ncbi:hypothetical protein TNIN_362211 [Trichonephila inaurata madagascariensis]|uniref:Uncharacterized protein n=1 Tax=Trichonephila inaurata madagascariensis TaxID=2747483 RepID=A0A8X6MIG7_9ARAC|nr:hypothetical protein TNIN_362211 [Trichonephila inaurata madagascariensis]